MTIGAACWTIATTLPAPVWDWAPNWRVSSESSSAMVAPNGMVNSAVGSAETLVTNQACSMNSRTWKGRRNVATATSRPRANSRPVSTSTTRPGNVLTMADPAVSGPPDWRRRSSGRPA